MRDLNLDEFKIQSGGSASKKTESQGLNLDDFRIDAPDRFETEDVKAQKESMFSKTTSAGKEMLDVTSANLFSGVAGTAGAVEEETGKVLGYAGLLGGRLGQGFYKALGGVTSVFSNDVGKTFSDLGDEFYRVMQDNKRRFDEAGRDTNAFLSQSGRDAKEAILSGSAGYQEYMATRSEAFQMKDLADPKFLLYDMYGSLIENAPMMVASIYTGGRAGGLTGASKVGAFLANVGGSTGVSTALNASREAEGKYSEILHNGGSKEQAYLEAERVFNRNFTGNAGLEGVQMALLFAPQLKFASPFLTKLAKAAEIGFAGVVEAGQERMEDNIQAQSAAANYDYGSLVAKLTDPHITKTDIISAALGIAVQGVGNVFVDAGAAERVVDEQAKEVLKKLGDTPQDGGGASDALEKKIEENPIAVEEAYKQVVAEQQQEVDAAKQSQIEELNFAEGVGKARDMLVQGETEAAVTLELAQKYGVDEAKRMVAAIAPEVARIMSEKSAGEAAAKSVADMQKVGDEAAKAELPQERPTIESLQKDIADLKEAVENAPRGSEEKKDLKMRIAEKQGALKQARLQKEQGTEKPTQPKTLKIVIGTKNGMETADVTPLGFGEIAGNKVFVARDNHGKITVTEYGTGLSVGNSKYKNPKRAIADVEAQLMEKAGNKNVLSEMFASAIKKHERVNEQESEMKKTQKERVKEVVEKKGKASVKAVAKKVTKPRVEAATVDITKKGKQDATYGDDNRSRGGTDGGSVPTPVQVGTEKQGGAGGDNAKLPSERGVELRDNRAESGERPATRLTNEQVAERVAQITEVSSGGEVLLVGEVTEDMREAANQYTPEGKTKDGRGVLDEYYTNSKMVDVVKSLFTFPQDKALKVLEPSVGVGNFLYALPDLATHTVVAHEINGTTARIAKIFHPSARVFTNPFETTFIDERGGAKAYESDYDIVIGNPPYGEHRGKYIGLGEENGISRYEDYFVKRGVDVLKDGGHLAMVLPSSFIDRQGTIADAELVVAYRFPEGIFEGTSIGTDLVVLRKKKGATVTRGAGYFTANPENVLGTVKERKSRFGKQEQYVDGTLDEAIAMFTEARNKHEAVAALKEEPTEDTAEQVDSVAQALDEGDSKEEAVKKSKATERGKKTIEKKVQKTGTKKNTETIALDEQFAGEYSEAEIDLWRRTLPDGSIEATKEDIQTHGDLLNFDGGRWYIDFNYMQGDIYEKMRSLEAAKEAKTIDSKRYAAQKKKLESVMPKQEVLDDVELSPNSDFVIQLELPTVSVDAGSQATTLRGAFVSWLRDLPRQAFGTSNSWEVIGYVNNEQVRGSDKDRNEKIREQRKRVAEDLFVKFLKEGIDADTRAHIEREYNRTYNFYHTPDFSKVPMFGKVYKYLEKLAKNKKQSPFQLMSVQCAGIGRLVNSGVGILAHDVGFGKTISGVLATNEILARGWAKRPLIVAPNENVYRQWVDTIQDLVPDAKLNLLGNLGAGFGGDLSSLEIPEGSFSIITYEGFKRLSFKDETYEDMASRFQYLSDELGKAKTAREGEKEKADTQRVAGTLKKGTRADLFFERLGFDLLTFDEIHNANHIVPKVKLEKGKASEFSRFALRQSDLGLKTWLAAQYIQSKKGGRNVIGLSATPFTNHPLEYYSVLSLVADKTLSKMGFHKVNEFFNTFMEAEHEYEFKADGTYQKKTDIRNFKNYRQFRKLLDAHIDFKDGESHGIKRPNRVQREYEIPANTQTVEMDARAQEIFKENEREEGKGAKVLRAINELRKIAFSPYASQFSSAPKDYKEFVENSPKLKVLMGLLRQNKKDNAVAGQIVYFDSVGVSFMPLVKEYMVKELGYKKDEVEIISGGVPKETRLAVQDRYNGGDVKIILGSEAIKEGMNLQVNTSDLYMLSLPWNFTQLRQVIGRAWRQGNQWQNVRINNLFIQDSIDVFLSQKLSNKQRRYEASIKSGNQRVDVGDISFIELMAELIRDPNTRAKLELAAKKEQIEQQIAQAKADLAFATRKIEKVQKLDEQIKDDTERLARQKEIYEKELKEDPANANDWWVKTLGDDIAKNTKLRNEELARLRERGENVDTLLERKAQNEVEITRMEAEEKALKDGFEQRVREISDSMPKREPFSDDTVARFVAERAEHNREFYAKVEQESEKTVRVATVQKDIKSVSGKVVKTKTVRTVVVEPKKAAKKDTKDAAMLKVLTDKTLTTQQKIDQLLGKKQEGKAFKDVGQRVAGSKKENAVIQAIFEHGNDEIIRALANELGNDTLLAQLDKHKILEGREVPTVEGEQKKGTPAWIAAYKVGVFNRIGRTPSAQERAGKYSTYQNIPDQRMQDFIAEYPTLLRQFVADLNAVQSLETAQAFEDKYRAHFKRWDDDKRVRIEVLGKGFGDVLSIRNVKTSGDFSSTRSFNTPVSVMYIEHKNTIEAAANDGVYSEESRYNDGETDWRIIGRVGDKRITGSSQRFKIRDEAVDAFKKVLAEQGWKKTELLAEAKAEAEAKLKEYSEDYGKFLQVKTAGTAGQIKNAQEKLARFKTDLADRQKQGERTDLNDSMRKYNTEMITRRTAEIAELEAFIARLTGESESIEHGNFAELGEYDVKDSRFKKSHVTAANLMHVYGFKSAQLGNYMDDASAHDHIVQTMAAMEDMSAMLGVDFAKLAKNHGLSVAFGARGSGGANAHYEPTHNIINLTKKRGDGSFGHEFMHFLDWKVGSATFRGKWSAVGGRRGRYYSSVSTDRLSNQITEALRSGVYVEVESEFEPRKDIDMADMRYSSAYKHREEGVEFDEALDRERRRQALYSTPMRESEYQAFADVYRRTFKATMKKRSNNFYTKSLQYGGGKDTSYWVKPHELWARAFQAYLEDKMEEKGIKNNYLTRGTKDIPVYPQGEERAEFNKMFDQLFIALGQEFPHMPHASGAAAEPRFKEVGTPSFKLTEGGQYLEDVKHRLGIDFDVMWVDSILTPDKKQAYGITYDNTIALARDMTDTTAPHEVVHLTLANLDKIKAFDGIARDMILEDKSRELGIEYNMRTEAYIEEQIALDFERFVADKHEPKGIMRQFFEKLLTLVRQFARLFVDTHGDVVRNYYEILDAGKAVDGEMVRIENNGILQSFVEEGVLDTSGVESPQFKLTITVNARDLRANSFDLNNARDDYKNGIRSRTKRNIQVSWNRGAYWIDDGHHRFVEGIMKGQRTFKVDVMPLRFKLKEDQHFANLKQHHNEIVTTVHNMREKLDANREQLARALNLREMKRKALADAVDEQVAELRKNLTNKGVLSAAGIEAAKELGYNPDEINTLLQEYMKTKEQYEQVYAETVKQKRAIAALRKEDTELNAKRSDITRQIRLKKRRLEQMQRDIEIGFKRGMKAAELATNRRRFQVRRVQEATGITEAQLRRLVGGRNFETMSPADFKAFMQDMIASAHDFTAKEGLQQEILAEIQFKQLTKFDNLRLSLGLPSLTAMTQKQLVQYRDALAQYEFGDVFLSQRLIETLHRTDFGNIKTIREFYGKLKGMGVNPEDLKEAKITDMTGWKNDVLLARDNTIFKWLVQRKHEAMINASGEMEKLRDEMNKKVRAARASRAATRTVGQRIANALVPTDEAVFDYIEAQDKAAYLKKTPLTDAEVDLANFLIAHFSRARDYLIAEYEMGTRFGEDYITHTRRSFLEILKSERNLLKVFGEMYQSQKDNKAGFDILAGSTDKILAFEKFFGYAMRRSGEIEPTKNVARAFEAYFGAFTKKKALDKLVPTIMAVAKEVDAQKEHTERGLLAERSVENFVKAYLNNVKGRKIDFGGWLVQDGAINLAVRGVTSIIYLKFLGFAVAINIASFGGEFVTVMKALTWRERVNYFSRLVNLQKNRRVYEVASGAIGRHPIKELLDSGNNISDIVGSLMFIGFSMAGFRGSRDFYRAALTNEEYNLGEVSLERLAELELRMQEARKGHRGYGASLVGSTDIASAYLQFKSWAMPLLTTLASDMSQLVKKLPQRTAKETLTSDEMRSVYSFIEIAALAWAITAVLRALADYEDDKSLLGNIINKTERDFNTVLQAMGTWWGSRAIVPVMMQQIGALQDALGELARMEEYERDGKGYGMGDLKGARHLKQFLTPTVIRQLNLDGEEEQVSTKENMVRDAIESGEFNAYDIAEFVNKNNENWIEGDPDYRKKKEGEISALYHLRKTYGYDNDLINGIKDGKDNEEKIAAMLAYTQEVGEDQARQDILDLKIDKNLCSDPTKKTGCLISGALWKEYKKALLK